MEQKTTKTQTNKQDLIINNIKDPNLKEVFLILVSNNILNLSKINPTGDIEGNLKQDIKEAVNDQFQEMNENFSELRKSGRDLGVLNFKMMMLPLKIKMFLSTYEKKDLENLLKRIKDIENEIRPITK
ncbi:MAG: hypothetical protein ACP5NZ_01920 [Nanobdellota archaeon]